MRIFILLIFLAPISVMAAVCEDIYDGDKAFSIVQGKPKDFKLNLIKNKSLVSDGEITAGQIQAFYNAKEKIQQVVKIYPKFVICADQEPNAFAFEVADGSVVGVSAGMLKLINGDEDMAAAVIGHEIAHHTKNHRQRSQQNQIITDIISTILGIYVEANIQRKYKIQGVGQNLAVIGSALTISKFSRDHEREADEVGFSYMLDAGYNPNGSIKLAETLSSTGANGRGLFYDTHPSWDERSERFKLLISQSKKAQDIIASSAVQQITDNRAKNTTYTEVANLNSDLNLSESEINNQTALTALSEGDFVKAEKYSRLAAEAGNKISQFNLGLMYEKGTIVKKDINEAIRLIKLSAAQGLPVAQTKMGFYYFAGIGVQKDDSEAIKWTMLAAEQGYSMAQYNMGLAYTQGKIKSVGNFEAEKWFRLAAEQGVAAAQASLGSILFNKKNYQEAIKWFQLATAQNHAEARRSLGWMYLNGLGVPKDLQEGLRLIRLSAQQGDINSINYLKNNNISY